MSEKAATETKMAEVARQGHSLCWHCQTELGDDPMCPSCVRIQPLGRNSDYFSVMGLPRKLSIDPRVLEPVFHALSRRFHPDMYRMASSRERMIALDNSSAVTVPRPMKRRRTRTLRRRTRTPSRQLGSVRNDPNSRSKPARHSPEIP